MVVLDGLGQGEILIGTRINIDLTNPGDVSWLKRDSGLRDSVVKRFFVYTIAFMRIGRFLFA